MKTMNTMKAFLAVLLLLGFTTFTAFSQTNAIPMTNVTVVVVRTMEEQEACFAAILNGQSWYGVTSLDGCLMSNLTQLVTMSVGALQGYTSVGEVGLFTILSTNTYAASSNYVVQSGLSATNISVSIATATTVSGIDTVGCFVVNEQKGTNATVIVDGKIQIESFLGKTNEVDYALRERAIVQHSFNEALGSGGVGNDLTDGDTAGVTNLATARDYASNVLHHAYAITNLTGTVNTNSVEGLMIDAQNRFWTNSHFSKPTDMNGSGSGYSTLLQQYGAGTTGEAALAYGNGLGGYANIDKFIWFDNEEPGDYRDPNLVLFFGIPKLQGTGWMKRIWIDADFSRWPFFKVIGVFIYVCIVWLLFAFGLKAKYESWKGWYQIHLLTSISSGVSATATNTLLASVNPLAIKAGAGLKLYYRIALVIAIASIGSFLIGLFFTFWRISQINPTSTGLLNMPIFTPAHSVASNLSNSKSLLASAWDLLIWVVPISMFFAVWLENWVFEAAVLTQQFIKRIFA